MADSLRHACEITLPGRCYQSSGTNLQQGG